MAAGDFLIRIRGVTFCIPRPTPRLLAMFRPETVISPSLKPAHIEADLKELGFVRKWDKLQGWIYVHKGELS